MHTRELFGRRQIFTDQLNIDSTNILTVLGEAFVIHEQNRSEIQYLFEYVNGKQPILEREKEIRPEINEHVVDNMASEILEFKLGYEFGSPITYVQRARKDMNSDGFIKRAIKKIFGGNDSQVEDMRIAAINEMLTEESKASKDLQLAKDVKTCGVGYRLILPKRFVTGSSVFDLLVLNPMNTFVVYSNDAYREPVLGVTYFPHIDGTITFGCYTKKMYFEIEMGVVRNDFHPGFKAVPNVLGMIPIVEYINDFDRMGCFERVIPLMDSLNTIDSDRVNDIAQHVQNLLWGDNIEIDDEQYKQMRQDGMIVTKSPTGRTATLKYLECTLDQSGNQLLVDYIKQQILDICSVPSRSELSGGSTGSATNMSTGWMAAETDAKAKEQIWTASERRETAVILAIIKSSNEVDADISELSLADLDVKFSRSRTYDLATKCNSLATLVHIGIDPLRAIETVGLFTDPQQVALDSAERIDKILFPGDSNNTSDDNGNDDPYKKRQPDITDQPSQKSVSD